MYAILWELTIFCIYVLILCSSCNQISIHQKHGNGGFYGKYWSKKGKCNPGWNKYSQEYWETFNSVIKNFSEHNCYLYTDEWIWNNPYVNTVFVNVVGSGTNCDYINEYVCSQHLILKTIFGKTDGSTKHDRYTNVSLLPRLVPKTKFYSYNETFALNVFGYSALRLMFHTTYYSGKIEAISLYYHSCPVLSKDLVRFPPTNAPNRMNSPITISGRCVKNSIPMTDVAYTKCYFNGSFTVHGYCVCDKGFQVMATGRCTRCAAGSFKQYAGNDRCKACGKNSVSSNTRVYCSCRNRFFREIGKKGEDEAHCYRPPEAPTILDIRNITQNSVVIDYQDPKESGNDPLGYYVVNCTNCQKIKGFPLHVMSSPFQITNLGSFTNYQMMIYNRNAITNLNGNYFFATFNFTTRAGGRPGLIRKFQVHWLSHDTVILKWEAPFVKGGKELLYIIKYGENIEMTRGTSVRLSSESSIQEYYVKIYAQVATNGNKVNGEVFTSEKIVIKGTMPLHLTVVIFTSVIIFMLAILIVSFCLYRRCNPPTIERFEDGKVKSSGRFFVKNDLYIDPTSYITVQKAVQTFTCEIERSRVTLAHLIGGGQYGLVFKGTLLKDNGLTTDVAIKKLRDGTIEKDCRDFLSEAAILGQFSHPNVIRIEGVIMKDAPHFILLEFMSNGSLLNYLKQSDIPFEITELLKMARDVAAGMTYLSEKGFIHRDLASRNILVDQYKVCKISDFGLCREIKVDDETYESQGGKIPLRWTSPEAIQSKKFTISSDCWSFGVLLWEIMSEGERPYWDWSYTTILQMLKAGYRLPIPDKCSTTIYNLMIQCWNEHCTKRPKFKTILSRILHWINDPDTLIDINRPIVTISYENIDVMVLKTIHEWLAAIHMEEYIERFLKYGCSHPKYLLHLTDNDLIDIGVVSPDHKVIIKEAIENTKQIMKEQDQETRFVNLLNDSRIEETKNDRGYMKIESELNVIDDITLSHVTSNNSANRVPENTPLMRY